MDDGREIQDIINDFNRAFGRPVNDRVVALTVTERELLGKLIFEECFEYCTKGLGLQLRIKCDSDVVDYVILREEDELAITLELEEGKKYDPIESADGLGDMNVVINFNASWHGFRLRPITLEIHDSNMSKRANCEMCGGAGYINDDWADGPMCESCQGLGGKPIINGCFIDGCDGGIHDSCPDAHLVDMSKPRGKILKGPNFRKPDIDSVLYYSEEMCPGHISKPGGDRMICMHCGVNANEMRPGEDE